MRDYTILSEAFPSVIIARLFRFPPREYFEVESSVGARHRRSFSLKRAIKEEKMRHVVRFAGITSRLCC